MTARTLTDILGTVVYGCALAGTIYWFAGQLIHAGVMQFYHPMFCLGLVGCARSNDFTLVALVAILISLGLLFFGRPDVRRGVYVAGSVALVLIVLAHNASRRIDTDYHHTYWLGDVRHEIPWPYGPFNGSVKPGGSSFLVKVGAKDFVPRYHARNGDTITLMKATDFDWGRGGEQPEHPCGDAGSQIHCEMRLGAFVYGLSADPSLLPTDVNATFVRVKDLLDSFEADAPAGNPQG